MASNIVDGFINYIRSHTRNYISQPGSIYYIVALKVHVLCTIVLWACDIQVEYVCKCSTYQGLAS